MSKKRVFKVIFANAGQIWELYARDVEQGAIFGFVEVSGLLFGEREGAVIDPAEERLKSEFAGVDRTRIPLHAIIRIDEVEKRGASRITPLGGKGDNVSVLPTPVYTPSGGRGDR